MKKEMQSVAGKTLKTQTYIYKKDDFQHNRTVEEYLTVFPSHIAI